MLGGWREGLVRAWCDAIWRNAYDAALDGAGDLILPKRAANERHVFHQYTICMPQRDALQQFLNAQEIPTMVYYPVPLHVQKPYLDSRHPQGGLPISEMLCQEVLSLPMHTEMDNDQLTHIVKQLINFYKKYYNAKLDGEWINCSLERDQIKQLLGK